MNTGSRVLILTVTLLLCQCLSEVECRRTTSISRRGQSSRRNNYGSSFQGPSTTIKKPASTSTFGSSSASSTVKKTSTGTKPSGTSSQSWANPYYKASAPAAPKQTGTYGWVPAGKTSQTNQFQKSGQPSSSAGSPPYPVNSGGFQPAGRTGWNTAQQPHSATQSHGVNTGQQSHGFISAQQAHGVNTAQQSHGYNPASPSHGYNAGQQSHGYSAGQQSHGYSAGQQSHGYQPAPQPHGFNTAQQPHGYTGQQSHGFNTAQQPHGYTGQQPHGYQSPQTHGYNAGQQPHGYSPPQTHGYNTGQQPHGYHPQPSYNQPSYHGGSVGGYHPTPNVAPHGFASSHGISPSYYPSQSSFGYPGQGLMSGSHGPKYGGLSLFNGGSGNYGYGSSGWGVPTYGAKSSSGKGKLLTGLALGAAGGYLTSSLINRVSSVSSPWGYSGWGYGNRYGYDRPIIIKEIRETTRTEAPPPAPAPAAEPDPRDNWISCVAFDPTINQTFINPNCSCTVTTSIDPMTGLPISTHNCTTANGQVLPPIPFGAAPPMQMGPQPPMDSLPPNAVNNPNATPEYGSLYNNNMRYGGGDMSMAPLINPGAESAPQANASPPPVNAFPMPMSTETPPPTTPKDGDESSSVASTTEAMMRDSPKELVSNYSPKVREFYSKLEEITNMGKII